MPSVASTIVEVCVFAAGEGGPRYLLLRRAPGERVYPGLWQFVTGSIEPGETAVEAARRELAEETGLVPTGFWVVPHVSVFYDASHDSMNLSPVFAARVQPGADPLLSAEHVEFAWLEFARAEERLVWPGQRQALRIAHEFIVRGSDAAGRTRID